MMATTLTYVSGSMNYPKSTKCKWMIASLKAVHITLHFTLFTELSTQAGIDFIHVYECMDIACLQQLQLAELSGLLSSPYVRSDINHRVHEHGAHF
jgi:hypothetical protein